MNQKTKEIDDIKARPSTQTSQSFMFSRALCKHVDQTLCSHTLYFVSDVTGSNDTHRIVGRVSHRAEMCQQFEVAENIFALIKDYSKCIRKMWVSTCSNLLNST
jgi:hypothetical protein